MAEVQAAAAGPVEEVGGDGEGGAQGAVDLERERVEHRVGAVVIDQGVALRVEDRDEGGVEGAVVIGGVQVDGDPGGVGVGEGDGVGGVLAVDAGKPGGGGVAVAVAVGLGEGGLGPVEFEGSGVGDVGGGGWNGGPGVEVVGVRCCPVRTVDLDVMSITFTVCVGCVAVVVDGGGEESGAGVGEVGGGDAGARGGRSSRTGSSCGGRVCRCRVRVVRSWPVVNSGSGMWVMVAPSGRDGRGSGLAAGRRSLSYL